MRGARRPRHGAGRPRSEGRFGYASRHLLIGLDPAREGHPTRRSWSGARRRCRCARCCSTHGPSSSTTSATRARCRTSTPREFDRRFTLAAGLLELADREFSAIRERLRAPRPDDEADDIDPDDPRIAPRELAAFLAGQYADAGWSRTDHYTWISGLLLELGVTRLVELGEVLRGADDSGIAARMDYRYPPGAVRRLDDALLLDFGRAVRGRCTRTPSAPDCSNTDSSD